MERSPVLVVCDQPEKVETKISGYRVKFISAPELSVKKLVTF
jgi:hypothetical protein